MYKEAYELIREILEDEKLNEFVKRTTGKRLAIIDSGPKVTFPAVGIVFRGGEISRPDNNMQEVQYDIPFGLPYFDANAMARCHEFLDVAIEEFFGGVAPARSCVEVAKLPKDAILEIEAIAVKNK